MKIGDLVVHIGAKPNGYRIRMVCGFDKEPCKYFLDEMDPEPVVNDRDTILFSDGRRDWKDQWRIFKGW